MKQGLKNVLIAGAAALSIAAGYEGIKAGLAAIFDSATPQQKASAQSSAEEPRSASSAVELYAMVLAAARSCPEWAINEGAFAVTFLKSGLSVRDLMPDGRFNSQFQRTLDTTSATIGRSPKDACEVAGATFGVSGWLVSTRPANGTTSGSKTP